MGILLAILVEANCGVSGHKQIQVKRAASFRKKNCGGNKA
jgi:hypothetical protein